MDVIIGIVVGVSIVILQVFISTAGFVQGYRHSFRRDCRLPVQQQPTDKELTQMAVCELWGDKVAGMLYR